MPTFCKSNVFVILYMCARVTGVTSRLFQCARDCLHIFPQPCIVVHYTQTHTRARAHTHTRPHAFISFFFVRCCPRTPHSRYVPPYTHAGDAGRRRSRRTGVQGGRSQLFWSRCEALCVAPPALSSSLSLSLLSRRRRTRISNNKP